MSEPMNPKILRWDVGEEGRWLDENGDWCASPDVAELEASLAAMQKELEQTERSLKIQAEWAGSLELENIAQAERIARLEEALQGLMAGCHYRDIQGDLDWHERTIPTKDALNFARAALAPPTP